jgi:hypothetical protein
MRQYIVLLCHLYTTSLTQNSDFCSVPTSIYFVDDIFLSYQMYCYFYFFERMMILDFQGKKFKDYIRSKNATYKNEKIAFYTVEKYD